MSDFSEKLDGMQSPYLGQITLGTLRGDAVVSEDPADPTLIISDSHINDITSLHLHVVKVSDPDSGEAAYVRRVVAKLDNGHEMDIVDPVALDAELTETGVDTSKCAACTMPLDVYDIVMNNGQAYHSYCIVAAEPRKNEKGQ